MAKLNSDQKEYIVKHLAAFTDSVEIVEGLKKEFNVKVTPSQVAFYNPENVQGTNLSKKWRQLFYSTRRSFIQEASKVPLFHKSYRLSQLQSVYDKAKEMGNIKVCLEILEQAAKETGGIYEKTLVDDYSNSGNLYQQINNIILKKDGY